MSEVVTVTLEESSTTEEEGNAAITADAFLPSAPLNAQPAAYVNGTTYPKGALVTDGTQVYRSLAAGNKENVPHEDAGAHWVPVSVSVVPLQNPSFGKTPTMSEQAHNNKPPARSDAAAAPLETIGTGAEVPLGE